VTSTAPTDPTGRSFLSYRRSRLHEATLLVQTQHELGIPTWQDLDDLDEMHTETQLRAVLNDPATANTVLWLTPDVADSAVIQRVEAPESVRREQRNDAFFVVPVAAGGLDYDQAAAVAGDRLGIHDLSSWNLRRVVHDPATREDVYEIASRVLRRRLHALHEALPEDEPFRVRLMTRRQPGFQTGWALSVDWSHHFTVRNAHPGAWQDTLLPALRTIRETLRSRAPRRGVEASGGATLSAGMAFGRAFLALDRDFELSWRQEAEHRPDQIWSLNTPPEDVPVDVDLQTIRTDGDALAVLLSITQDVEPAFGSSRATLPTFRAAVAVRPPGDPSVRPPGDPFPSLVIDTPGKAVQIVDRTVETIRRARAELGTTSTHIFGAMPVGLAVLLGQRLNTLGPVQTYEHDPDTGTYQPEVLLPEDI